MAEPVSAIVTIATSTLVVIRETIKFISEANVFDQVLIDLIAKLKELRQEIKVVKDTYERASYGDDTPASKWVLKILDKCQTRLPQVKRTVTELAARRSDSFLQKAVLKIRSSSSMKEIVKAIDDIEGLLRSVHNAIGLWNLDLSSANRRIEALLREEQATLHTSISRTLSNSRTIVPEDDWPARRVSSSTSHSRPSVSSSASNPDPNSASNPASPAPDFVLPPFSFPQPDQDADFQFQLSKCKGNDGLLQKIRESLQANPQLASYGNKGGRTPLHVAAQHGNMALARILLGFSVDINAKDSEGASALDLAVEKNRQDFVDFLLAQNVDRSVLGRNKLRFMEIADAIDLAKEAAKKKKKSDLRSTKRSSRRRSILG